MSDVKRQVGVMRWTLLTAIVLFIVFLGFVFLLEQRVQSDAEATIQRHSNVLSGMVWNFNDREAQMYLELVSEVDSYGRASITTMDGDSFVGIKGVSPPILYGLLKRIGLVEGRKLQSEISYNEEIIGELKALWYPDTLQTHLYFLLILVLIGGVLHLVYLLYQSKITLAGRVRERTQKLADEVKKHRRTEEKLEESLEEKKILLQEVHHRVKNNLFTIVSLLKLQEMETEDSQLTKILQRSVNRIHSLALIHQELYSRDEYVELDFSDYLKKLIENIKETLEAPDQEITVDYSLDEMNLHLDQSIPCALAINELVNNAFQHGFEGKASGRLKISAEKGEQQAKITISNNGRGLPEDFSLEEYSSMGLNLATKLIQQQLKGSVSFEEDDWVTFVIEFPV